MIPATTSVFSAIAELDALTETLHPTEWIIIDHPLYTALGPTRLLRKGMMVRVDNNAYNDPAQHGPYLIDCGDHYAPTHVIIALRNNIHNTAFEIDCEKIGGEEVITIKL